MKATDAEKHQGGQGGFNVASNFPVKGSSDDGEANT